jgi:hypothetical protein
VELSPWFGFLVAAWLSLGVLLTVVLVVAGLTGERIDPSEWQRCAGHDPANPAEKQCWVRIADGQYCPRHDGTGPEVIYS